LKPANRSTAVTLTLILLSAMAAAWGAGSEGIELDPEDAWGLEGFYPVERDGAGTPYRWSRKRSLIHFRGIDRSQGLSLTLEVRGWRPEGVEPPTVSAEVDGSLVWEQPLQREWQWLHLGVGPVESDHLDLVLETIPFRPADIISGSEDRRTLGLELRRVRLEVPTRPAYWVALGCASAVISWLLTSKISKTFILRVAWTCAGVVGALWVGLGTVRPYVLDASPDWTVPLLRAVTVALILLPFFSSTWKHETSRAAPLAALAGCSFTVFAPALGNGFFWDDFTFARPVSLSQWLFTFHGTWNWTGIGNDYYRPLIVTLFQVDYLTYGFWPVGYHLTNIVLHILNSYLVFHILSGWIRWRWALAGAALFALHPMSATGMAWISQRTDVLSTTFYLLALIAVGRYLENPSRRHLVYVGAAYAAALAAKEMAITFPAVALGYALARRGARRALPLMLVLAGVSALYVTGWATLFHYKLGGANVLSHLAANPFVYTWHSLLRLSSLVFVPVFYPSHEYEYLTEESLLYLYGGGALFLTIGLLIWKWGKSEEKILFGLGAAWILVTVIPLYNLEHPDFIRLGYLPAVGAGMVASAFLSFLGNRPMGKGLAAVFFFWSLVRALPIDHRIIEYWGPHGDLVQVVNRYKQEDGSWQDRLDPRALALFKAQRERIAEEKEHVERLLNPPR
jgi:hypothetical protein